MIIKVCGMREEANVREVEQLGADWMGFIFYPKSPRYVGKTLAYLPESVKKVGVFVNEDTDRLLTLAEKTDWISFNYMGTSLPSFAKRSKKKIFSLSRHSVSPRRNLSPLN
jgi:phosphoribosylanthranilate isomerase